MPALADQEISIYEYAEVVVEDTDALLSAPDGEAAWLMRRREGIGGSDAAAAMGLSPFDSPLSLFYAKRGDYHAEVTEAMEMGHLMEPVIGDLFARQTGLEVVRWKRMLRSRQWPWMQVNLDFLVPAEDAVAEAKNVGFRMADEWIGEHTEPLVPAHYLIQGEHELAVTGRPRCYFPALIGGAKFRYVVVERDEELIADIAEQERRFWEMFLADTPPLPDAHRATTAALKRAYPSAAPGLSVEVPRTILAEIAERAALKAQVRAVQAEIDAIENHWRLLLGEAEMATVDGVPVLSLKQIDRDGYTVAPSSYRRFSIPKPTKKRR
jgi:putative phage-type endonuclease